jgi:endonuclease-3
MEQTNLRLLQILDSLEGIYGPQKLAGPTDPYEMIVFLNCGYPATDALCAKCFDALKREIGTHPEKLLAASKAKLTNVGRLGGIVPEARGERLKGIARKVKGEFAGDLTAAIQKRMRENSDQPEEALKAAKKVLQEFPVIGEPSAEKILLFSKLAPVAAVPSAFLHVPVRLFVGEPGKNYAAEYRAAREILDKGLPRTYEARQRAYLLLKKHGQETCKRSKPKCEVCPLTAQCSYLQAKAADSNTD